MQAPDSIGSRICQRRLCDDAYLHHRRLSADPVSQKRQYTLFIYNSGGLLADEHCLLHQTETIRDSRRGNYRRRIRDASASFLVTLFLAFTKRNDDFRLYEQTGTKPRVSITGYNKTFINEATAIIASVTMVCYIMYSMSPEVIERMGTRYVYLTSGWVLAGLLRYLQNMIVFGLSGSPTKSIVKDHFVQFCILGWFASFFAIIYL